MKISYGEQKRLTAKRKELIKQIDEIVTPYFERGMKITVRQVYYQCVARKIIDNNKQQYDKISDVIADGRMHGLIDWDVIEDRTRFKRGNSHWTSPKEIIEAAAAQYKIDTRATQPYYIECWIEKDSLVSILENCCNALDIPCFSCRGFPSITALHEAAIRFNSKDKRGIILYAGDHDPSGLKIPQVIDEKLKMFGADIELRRIGLTLEQIKALNVPPFYAKEKDGNYDEYVKSTGTTYAWELDALPPEQLTEIFKSNIDYLTDDAEFKKMLERDKKDKRYFLKFTKK